MGYVGASRMNAFTSPPPAPGQLALTLGWRFNARGQLDRVTRADRSLVETTFDETTAAVTDVSFPGLGVLHREHLPLTVSGALGVTFTRDVDPDRLLTSVGGMPRWPRERYHELTPLHWRGTRARLDPDELKREHGPLTVPAPAPGTAEDETTGG